MAKRIDPATLLRTPEAIEDYSEQNVTSEQADTGEQTDTNEVTSGIYRGIVQEKSPQPMPDSERRALRRAYRWPNREELVFKEIPSNKKVERARVHGGWLVTVDKKPCFVPDPSGLW